MTEKEYSHKWNKAWLRLCIGLTLILIGLALCIEGCSIAEINKQGKALEQSFVSQVTAEYEDLSDATSEVNVSE